MIIQVYDDDLLNGIGIREVAFLQGCTHHCLNCFNPETWEIKEETKESLAKTQEYLNRIEHKLKCDYIHGLTISGGDPMLDHNIQETNRLINLARKYNKSVWVYSGFTYDVLKEKQFNTLKKIDVLCDGPFIEKLKSPEKPWVGSSNQRVIDVQRSLYEDKIILYNEK